MTELLLMTYLANALWMTCLVAAAAMVVARLVDRGPSGYRHALWVMALAGACFVPLTGLRSGPVEIAQPVVVPVAAKEAITSSTGEKEAATHESFWLKIERRRRPVSLAPLLTETLAYAYLGFVLYRGLCLVWAWRLTRRILRNARPCSLAPRHAALVERCSSYLCAGPVSLACSGGVQSPMVLGVRRQVLIFPERFVSKSTEEELTSALCHELAHVRRHDFLLNLVYQAFWLPISFHPAAWFIKQQIDRTRELACDEMAAEKLPTRAVYARSLLNMAESIASAHPAGSGYALGLFDTNTLEERIRNLLSKTDRMDKSRGRALAFVASGLLAAACLAASAFSIEVARAGNTPEELKQFAGTWEGKFKGKTFITVKLAAKEGKISGTVSRISIQMSDQGKLTEAIPLDGEDAIAEAVPDGKVLRLTTKAKGEVSTTTGDAQESIQYDMRLTGVGQAELQIASAPPGGPAPAPWKLQRKPSNP